MHPEDADLQRWLHQELSPAEREALSVHLADCAACRDRLARGEAEDRWIRERILLAAPRPPVVSLPTAAAHRWLQRAAVVLLSLGLAGVAYALPGSPVPGLLRPLTAWLSPRAQPAVPAAEETGTGIVVSLEPHLTLRFAGAPRGSVRVSLVDAAAVTVEADRAGPRFTSAPGMLTIESAAEATEYRVEVPRVATWFAIEAGGRQLYLQQQGRIEAVSPPDSTGSYLLSLGDGP